MARDNKNAWDRFREREEDRLREEAEKSKRDTGNAGRGGANILSGGHVDATEQSGTHASPDLATLAIVSKCEVMLEQITNLYQMYIAGQERIPPISQRKHLEDLILKIQAGPKAMKATQFQCTQFLAKYAMYKEKWDRTVRDIETGKTAIRRRGA